MKKIKKSTCLFIAALLATSLIYIWHEQWRLDCLLGKQVEVQFGVNTVRMTACWYPLHVGQEGTAVSFIGRRINPLEDAGYVDILFLPELSSDARALIKSSISTKKHAWGTAVHLNKNWIYTLMKQEPSPEIVNDPTLDPTGGVAAFIPERNILIRASRFSDLDEITSISRTE